MLFAVLVLIPMKQGTWYLYDMYVCIEEIENAKNKQQAMHV